MAVMKDKRHYLSACTINDEFIYAFGGFFGSTEQEINDTIEVFEVEKNTWSVLTVRMKVSYLRYFLIHYRTLYGLAALFLSPRLRSSWLEARTRIEMEKSIYLMLIAKHGNPSIQWISYVFRIRVSSFRTKSTLLEATTTWVVKCTTSKKISGASFRATTRNWITRFILSLQPLHQSELNAIIT